MKATHAEGWQGALAEALRAVQPAAPVPVAADILHRPLRHAPQLRRSSSASGREALGETAMRCPRRRGKCEEGAAHDASEAAQRTGRWIRAPRPKMHPSEGALRQLRAHHLHRLQHLGTAHSMHTQHHRMSCTAALMRRRDAALGLDGLRARLAPSRCGVARPSPLLRHLMPRTCLIGTALRLGVAQQRLGRQSKSKSPERGHMPVRSLQRRSTWRREYAHKPCRCGWVRPLGAAQAL